MIAGKNQSESGAGARTAPRPELRELAGLVLPAAFLLLPLGELLLLGGVLAPREAALLSASGVPLSALALGLLLPERDGSARGRALVLLALFTTPLLALWLPALKGTTLTSEALTLRGGVLGSTVQGWPLILDFSLLSSCLPALLASPFLPRPRGLRLPATLLLAASTLLLMVTLLQLGLGRPFP